MQFVDSHCHLDYPSYKDDLVEVLQRSKNAGVIKIIVPGLDLESSRQAIDLANRFSPVYAAIGVHPSDVEKFSIDQIQDFERLAMDPNVVAIGEIGLDLYYRQDNLTSQIEVLQLFLALSLRTGKPMILHSRESLSVLFEILNKQAAECSNAHLRGIFHAFEGNLEDAKTAISMGYFIGAGGPVTYKNAFKKHEVFSKIDLSNIVLETDGPFLSPQPCRGKRNEPANIPLIAQKIAELQQCDIKEVAYATTNNINNLLNWTE